MMAKSTKTLELHYPTLMNSVSVWYFILLKSQRGIVTLFGNFMKAVVALQKHFVYD